MIGCVAAAQQLVCEQALDGHLHEGDVAEDVGEAGAGDLARLQRVDAAEALAQLRVVQRLEVVAVGVDAAIGACSGAESLPRPSCSAGR